VSAPTRLWNRSFALLWQGQLVSSLGKNAFQLAALLWLKETTGSGTLSGLIGGMAMLPMVLLGPFAGVLVDRTNRGRLIAWTDIAGGALVALAAALFFALPGNTPLLLAAVFVVTLGTGLLDTFSQPSISASIPDLVPKEKLEAANGLNLSAMHAAMLVAQALAGLLYRLIGAPLLVAVNAVAYLWAGTTELGVRTPDRPRPAAGQSPASRQHPVRRFLGELAEGARWVWNHRGLRTLLLLFTVLNFLVAPLLALMAFFVEDWLGLGPEWLGYLMACYGGGGLAGFAVAGAWRVRGRARLALVAGATIVQSAMVVLMVAMAGAVAQVALFLVAGISGGIANVHFMTLMQNATPGELQGRVQSLSGTLSVGVMPIGMALAGVFYDLTGGNVLLVIGLPGFVMLAASVAALASREYRRFLAGTDAGVAGAGGDARP
jgi:DHA3 family macrolide efflux protein-like MFS transporter